MLTCLIPLNLSPPGHLSCFCYEIFFHILTQPSCFFFNSWMICHCVYLSPSMNTCSFHDDHLGCACRLGRSKAGHRSTCWDQEGLHLSLEGKGSGGGWGTRIWAVPSQSSLISPLLDIYLCSCLSISYARLNFCPRMSWNASQLPIVIFYML